MGADELLSEATDIFVKGVQKSDAVHMRVGELVTPPPLDQLIAYGLLSELLAAR